MCWILAKEKDKTFPMEYIIEAEKKNKDGYGISWYDGSKVETFKTLDFEEFLTFLKDGDVEQHKCVIHLRNTTAGCNSLENTHPFKVPSGVMFHNGTIFTMKPKNAYGVTAAAGAEGMQSDTANLAKLINSCSYETVQDIAPLLQQIIGDTINRLVFFSNDGTIAIINKQLGISEEENGYWMSNDYHIPKPKTYAFVYGTLKEGYGNHAHWMGDLVKHCDAETEEKWAMIGKDMAFPYLLSRHSHGHNVKGELYEVEESDLKFLDILEGAPRHYRRQPISVVTGAGEVITATTYVKTTVGSFDLEKDFIKEF